MKFRKKHNLKTVQTILRPQNISHNYEYPNLVARPSSETALSINEKCQNFINTNNFDRTAVEEAARRISDASGVASLKSSGAQMSMDSVSFEGPIYRKSLESNPALSNYDVPRLLDGGCYDVPPIPVPVRIKKIVEPALQSIFSSAAC